MSSIPDKIANQHPNKPDQADRNLSLARLAIPVIAMAVIIVASNILVEIPITEWLVWGTLTYPVAFLITDLTNRTYGATAARRVIYAGFVVGVIASLILASPRIALASGAAFLVAQLCDVAIFNKLRNMRSERWWVAPLTSSIVSTLLDTFLFFALAFVATGANWIPWATTDLGVKWVVALVALIPYRVLSGFFAARTADQASAQV